MIKRLFLVILLVSGVAFAGDIGVNFSSWSQSNNSSVWSLGYSFYANSNTTVIALGAYDYLNDGFAQPQQVGLWDASQNLLASVYVTNGDTLIGYWRFHDIPGVSLTAGDLYYVASQGGEGYVWYSIGMTVAPEITFNGDAWHYIGTGINDPLYLSLIHI